MILARPIYGWFKPRTGRRWLALVRGWDFSEVGALLSNAQGQQPGQVVILTEGEHPDRRREQAKRRELEK